MEVFNAWHGLMEVVTFCVHYISWYFCRLSKTNFVYTLPSSSTHSLYSRVTWTWCMHFEFNFHGSWLFQPVGLQNWNISSSSAGLRFYPPPLGTFLLSICSFVGRQVQEAEIYCSCFPILGVHSLLRNTFWQIISIYRRRRRRHKSIFLYNRSKHYFFIALLTVVLNKPKGKTVLKCFKV
jgi:hypothetical protein